ncbi:hypothetical protein ACI65C_005067 [Semiaphis heraclei]
MRTTTRRYSPGILVFVGGCLLLFDHKKSKSDEQAKEVIVRKLWLMVEQHTDEIRHLTRLVDDLINSKNDLDLMMEQHTDEIRRLTCLVDDLTSKVNSHTVK